MPPFIDHTDFNEPKQCNHPEHNPPSMILLPSGIHTWQCPCCKKKTPVMIDKITC